MRDVPPDIFDDPVRQLANTILYLTKEEAARRHILAAVQRWHDGALTSPLRSQAQPME